MARKPKHPMDKLKEGEFPTRRRVATATGERLDFLAIENVPPSQRPKPALIHTPLGDYLLGLLAEVNVRGNSGLDALLILCKMGAYKYDSLKSFVVAWYDLHEEHLFREIFPLEPFAEPTLEQCCDVAKIPYEDFVGDVNRILYWYGLEGARARLTSNLPAIIGAISENAIEGGPKGFQDRKLAAEIGGLIQSGPAVVVNNNTGINVQNNVMGLPAWEETDKLAETAFKIGPKQLPAATNENVIEIEKEQSDVERINRPE